MRIASALLSFAAISQTFGQNHEQDQAALQLETPNKHNNSHLKLTHDLIGLHANLTSLESITGNEEGVGEWLVGSLTSQGYHVEKQYVDQKAGRFNIVAWPGKKQLDVQVLLTSHIDTVPPFYPYKHSKDPAESDNSTLSGRGSVDAKASVAAQIIALNNLMSSSKISPDSIALLYVVGEETGGDGMRAANALHLKPRTIIFGEPTEGKLASGHKGNLGLVLTAKGKAAHSGYPWLGRSANEVLVTALSALMSLGETLPSSEKYGVTTLNIGKIQGGVAANVISQDANATIAVRIASGTPAFIRDEITKTIHHAIRPFLQDGKLTHQDVIEISFTSAGYGPVAIDHDVPDFESMTVNYGTDIPNFNQTAEGQKRYLYGPGSILVAHSDHEMLSEEELRGAVGDYEKIILHAVGK
ncbi:hypothetical protein LTR62_005515 [Meristemomyces frigidus]|uniref:Peptidase M20 dimerisation domain-containing protein n=1 Tax=Meristemomyces frigidus TaxID=1508187 RepID=A0AAN7YF96_9PEZI|nr:hypothetical protein LTR62_005515 [Meristemomyces frigidus]